MLYSPYNNSIMDSDRRKFMRFSVSLPAEVVSQDQDNTIGLIKDFSRFGMRMACDSLKSDFSGSLALKIKNPLVNEYIDARAEIIWKNELKGKCELGLRLVDISPEVKTEILDHAFGLWKEAVPKTAHN